MTNQEFFKKHTEKIRTENRRCEECGERLDGIVAEVAHILPKARFKSVATNDNNILYLCSWNKKNNCHGNFDTSSNSRFKKMKVFSRAKEKVGILFDIVQEKITLKDYNRYE